MQFFKSHSKTNALIASLVFAISCVVYYLTMAPSICLWDCGEYLAASADLGLPHPPGTPLLILMGRVWLVLTSFIKDVGFRYNLFSIVFSALTVMLIYLIIVRALTLTLGEPDTLRKRLIYYCAAFMGSLLCAFSNTFWFESLEGSEQSNITNVPVALSIWLTLVWAQSKSEKRDNLLLLIGYVAFLCIGMHMISMITMPAIFLFVMLYDKEKRQNWRLWFVCVAMGLIMYNLSYFLIIAPIVTVLSLIMIFLSQKAKKQWQFCFLFCFLALLGFSNHLYLPIRSNLNPMLDEGHPVTMTSLREYLDRKQYGNESMISRSMWRRGSLDHQFGIEGHMGYGGFHLTQFFHFGLNDQEKNFVDGSPIGYGKLLIYLIPTLLMLLGWYWMYKKNKSTAAFFIIITLLTTVVMVWYMNFSDGTRAEHSEYLQWLQAGKPGPMPTVYREVRVRDYFYSAGFMFFSMWIGLSIGLLLNRMSSDNRKQIRGLVPLGIVLFTISPVLPLTQNYALRDRSQNWVPFEYAYNMLSACDPNSILFTNGDNDTFPLWAIQEAYGYRQDVRIVNLSLVNTNWYIKELKSLEPKVPITYTENQIDHLQPEYNPFETPTAVELAHSKLQLTIPGRSQQQVMRVQDKMVLNIVDANAWSKTVYFACTVSSDNLMGLDPYLKMEGMVNRIMPTPVSDNDRIDTTKLSNFLDKVAKLRPFPAHVTERDEPYEGIYSSYGACFMYLAMRLQEDLSVKFQQMKELQKNSPQDSATINAKQAEISSGLNKIVSNLDRCISYMPWNMQPISMEQQILLKFQQPNMAEERIRKLLSKDANNEHLRDLLVQVLQAQGKQKEVQDLLQRG